MPSLNRNEKVKCENCGTQSTQPDLARHKKISSAGSLTCSSCTGKSHIEDLYHFRALVLHLHRNEKLEEKSSYLFNLFLEKTSGTDSATFRGVCV